MFKSIWQKMLLKSISFLTSSEFVEEVKVVVATLFMDDKLEGSTKRKIAYDNIKDKFGDFGESLINLAIEAVVVFLKSQDNEYIKLIAGNIDSLIKPDKE